MDTARTRAGDLIDELEQRSVEEGFDVSVSSHLDGYLETRWLNLITGEPDDRDVTHPQRSVLLRFWVDPVGPLGYRLTAEAVYRRVLDPSLEQRQTELMVPRGHDGETILLRILAAVRARFPG